MSRFKRMWRHESSADGVPSYLEPIRPAGKVRFDSSLRTAAEIMRERSREPIAVSAALLELEMPLRGYDRPAA